MRHILLVSATLMLATPAMAQQNSTATTNVPPAIGPMASTAPVPAAAPIVQAPVWDKVSLGMTRQQVEALYPRGDNIKYEDDEVEISDVHIMEKCDAEANIYFNKQNIVDRVMIAGNPSMGGRCSRDVLAALSSKYGQPVAYDKSSGSILARQGKLTTWRRDDGVTLQFKKYENGIFGGGGLLKASWELTYTDRGKDISL